MIEAHYIICNESYEIEGIRCIKGAIEWKAKTVRPLLNGWWSHATNEEISKHLEKTNETDMRIVRA